VKFDAEVEFHPVMLGDDLGKANIAEIGKRLKYTIAIRFFDGLRNRELL